MWRFDERHHLHLAATFRATQRVDFIDTLDQHRPRLAAARSCGLLGQRLVGCISFRLLAHTTRLVGVPAIIANQMRALRPGTRAERWSVLRELCQEIEWREDLKIPIRARSEVVGMRVGKGLTSLLLGFVDNLSNIGYLD